MLTIYEETQKAIEFARSGGGPTLLEIKTYRFKPHYPIFEEDRPAEEVEKWLKRDPLTIHAERLKEKKLLTDEDITAMDQAILQEIEEAPHYLVAFS